MKKKIIDIQFLLRFGIKIYPQYVDRDKYDKGAIKYRANSWYLVVNNNGNLTMYPKEIGKGKILNGKQLILPVEKTAAAWRKKLEEYQTKNNKT